MVVGDGDEGLWVGLYEPLGVPSIRGIREGVGRLAKPCSLI